MRDHIAGGHIVDRLALSAAGVAARCDPGRSVRAEKSRLAVCWPFCVGRRPGPARLWRDIDCARLVAAAGVMAKNADDGSAAAMVRCGAWRSDIVERVQWHAVLRH